MGLKKRAAHSLPICFGSFCHNLLCILPVSQCDGKGDEGHQTGLLDSKWAHLLDWARFCLTWIPVPSHPGVPSRWRSLVHSDSQSHCWQGLKEKLLSFMWKSLHFMLNISIWAKTNKWSSGIRFNIMCFHDFSIYLVLCTLMGFSFGVFR